MNTQINQPRAIVGLICLLAMGPMFFLLMPLYIGAMVDHLGMSDRQAGLLSSLELLGSCAAAVVAVIWIHRITWTLVAAGAATALLAGNVLSLSMAADVTALTALRLLTGFAAGTLVSLACAGLGDTDHPDRNFALGVVGQLALSGILFLVLPPYIARFGAAAIFSCFAVCGFLALLGAALLPASGREHTPVIRADEGALRPLWGLFGGAAFFVANTAVWAYIERVGIASELSGDFIGQVLGISVFVSLTGPLAAAWLAERCNHFWIMLAALVGELICLVFLRAGMSALAYAGVVLAYQLCWNLWLPLQMSVVARVDSTGRFAVLIPLFQTAGIATGPALAAALLAPGDYLAINMIGVVFALVSLALFVPLTLGSQPRRHDIQTAAADTPG